MILNIFKNNKTHNGLQVWKKSVLLHSDLWVKYAPKIERK